MSLVLTITYNFSRLGSIIEKFYGRDNVHINRKGTKILASNNNKSLKEVLGIKVVVGCKQSTNRNMKQIITTKCTKTVIFQLLQALDISKLAKREFYIQ